jgi:hypothetical protein
VIIAVEPVRTPPPEAVPSAPARRAMLDQFTCAAVLGVLVVKLAI